MTADQTDPTEELAEDQCWELLARARTGRLAVAIGEHPDIFPIHHVVDGRTIVFRTAPGTKLAAAVMGTGVAFEVDHTDEVGGVAWSVVLKGLARELHTVEEMTRAEELPLYPWDSGDKHHFVAITPQEITGRRFHAVPKG